MSKPSWLAELVLAAMVPGSEFFAEAGPGPMIPWEAHLTLSTGLQRPLAHAANCIDGERKHRSKGHGEDWTHSSALTCPRAFLGDGHYP